MTDAARWQQIKDLLDRMLDLPTAERRAFLEDAAGEDPALIDEVWALGLAAEPALDALEHPAGLYLSSDDEADLADLEGLEGTNVGAYRLNKLLGRGGMGVVYAAERLGDVGGTVAVKLIRRGMDSALVERRFRRERRILARLNHPHIAHLVDGGVTDDGRPFFVMERVEGLPITDFCKRHGLSVEGRVRLFLRVLDAVAFAHRNLVVHRDLKPSNILVRDDGVVKLLDFGVAKVLDEEDDEGATLTRLGGRVLTPSYSSPEQVRGEPVSTASDLYSLGVVLYELLAGRRPFDLDTASIAEVQRVVSFEEPTRPSVAAHRHDTRTRATGTRPDDTVPLAPRKLSGDLDAILLRALRKEPGKRYESATAFHDDLCRYLDHRPVAARRGSWSYHAERFLRRNRTGVAAVAAIVLVMAVAGVWVGRQVAETRRQAAIAAQRVEDVQALVNTLLFEVHDAVATLPGSTGARKLILDRAHEYLDDVASSTPDDPAVSMRLAGAYRRLGEVEGRPTGPSLGDLTAARASFERGLELARSAVAADSTNWLRQRALGLLHERLAGALVFAGDVEPGVEHSRQAQAIYERIADAWPDSVRHQLTAVIGRINLSDFEGHPGFPNLGRMDDATAGYEEARARLSRPPLLEDTGFGVVRFRGLVEERLARMLRVTGDLEGALARYRASLDVRAGLFEEYPNDDDVWRDIGVTHQNLCSVHQGLGTFDAAERECREAIGVYRARFRADSLNVQTLSDLSSIHDSYQELFLNRGDTLQALGHLDLMAEWAQRRLARDPSSLPARQRHLDALLTRGLVLASRGAPLRERDATFALVDALAAEGHLSDEDVERAAQLRSMIQP